MGCVAVWGPVDRLFPAGSGAPYECFGLRALLQPIRVTGEYARDAMDWSAANPGAGYSSCSGGVGQ